MWKLKSFVAPYWLPALLAPLLMILEVWMDLSQPKLMAAIVNDGITGGDQTVIWRTGAIMLGVALIGLIGGAGCTYFSSIAAQGFGADLRMRLFSKVQTFSFRQLDRYPAGSLITRLTGDIVQLQQIVQILLRMLVRDGSLLIGSIIMAIVISPRLSLILAFVIPIQFVIVFILVRRSVPLFSRMQGKLDGVNTVLQENASGMRVVKAFVRGEFERKRFGRTNSDYLHMALRAARTVAANMPLMLLLLNTSLVAVLWYGGAESWESRLPIGDLAAFLTYMTQLLFALLSVGNTIMNFSRAKASADRVNEVLGMERDMEDVGKQALQPAEGSGRVEFQDVSFAYGIGEASKKVLQGISFTAEPGQTIGILGATGSGKSSLVGLISRLYDPVEGRVLIDGTDVRDIPAEQLRNRVGMVLQQSILFSGTIRDNIRFGKPKADDNEVIAAARAAEAHDFIASFPDGYDTLLGQRGVNLSGGQKQRISIARALLMRTQILVLDDSTSAIDLATEKRIQRSLQTLLRTSTRIIIAQRISSVMQADRILVLDEGRIAASGTHNELMAGSRLYQDIYQSQQRKEEAMHG
ncbi:ABC transporter ATP-binding protein [Paenibacillus nasutitermitis]|uniref:ABC transporter n=1 Tax=Paenibacillus nasutitermitis TaxID=1652958 RepID=A0A917DZN2_9BACL|nr:ABC transporter ATP-binding protein [Paenibacillus nasutitermitis]GGD82204.1 ABC transporter [Paenibacillus nasutitermitis]